MGFALHLDMPVAPNQFEDYALATLLLLIAVPRLILALVYDHPVGVEGTLSMLCVLFALVIIVGRLRRR